MHRFLLFFVACFITSNAVEDRDFFEIKIDREHPEKIYEEFEEFIVKYNRKYKNPAEKQMRLRNFIKSHNQVEEFNRVSNQSGHSAHFAINKFSDLSEKEFKARLSNVTPQKAKPQNGPRRIKRQAEISFKPEVDLRYEKVNRRYIVTPPKDQGSCGCCWGFAATAVAEAVHAQYIGKLTNLSSQELCDCATPGSLGCTGGDPEWGVGHIFGNGLASEEDYRWEESRANETGRCASLKTKRTMPVAKFDYHQVEPSQAEYEMMAMLSDWKSPVAVSFAVGSRFQTYTYGVLYIHDCRKPGAQFHAGAIVGYGVEEDTGVKYWLVKNSWGADWGDGGYFKVIRGDDWCGIESFRAYGGRLSDHTHA